MSSPDAAAPLVRPNPTMETDAIWNELSLGIKDVYNQKAMTTQRFMELYTHVYNYCTRSSTVEEKTIANNTRNRGTKGQRPPRSGTTPSEAASYNGSAFIGHNLYSRIRDHLQAHLEERGNIFKDKMGEDLLTAYHTEWTNYTFSSKVVNGFCQYLNRHWVRRECDEGKDHIYQIYQLALDTWKQTMFQIMNQRITTILLSLIQRDRMGDKVNTGLIKGSISSYVELGSDLDPTYSGPTPARPANAGLVLGIYKNKFENEFIQETENFYSRESNEFLSKNSVIDYMVKAETRILEEQSRVELYLHTSTLDRLMKTCDSVLISKHIDLLHAEFPKLLHTDTEKMENLSRVYYLVSRLNNSLEVMKSSLQQHIISEGLDAVRSLGDKNKASNDPKLYVTTILNVHQKYWNLVSTAFKGDPGFIAALDKGCRAFINNNYITQLAKSPQRSPEIVARYCDQLLRKSGKNSDEEELEDSLNKVMIVFKFLDDKDVFQKFYSKLLSTRLVSNMSSSDDAESSMISKLKFACGFEYTIKLQRMYQDVSLSKDTNEAFRQWCTSGGEGAEVIPLDFYVHVLSSGSWPFSQSFDFQLPAELVPCVTVFNSYYNFKHNGRKLSWLYNRSKGEIVSNGYKTKYIFQATTYQIGILLQFNNSDSYSVSELIELSQLKEDVILQVLQILVKLKVLTADAPEEEMKAETRITFFQEYKNKKLRVNLNIPMKMEQKIESEQTHAAIEDERIFTIQAAIVRIMKMRKELSHQTLIGEVCAQLTNKFKPVVNTVRKCIDMLIEKEYLERKDGDMNTILYKA